MSANSFTEVTHQSWGSRLKGSFLGLLIGLVLFAAAFPVLFLNEGRAIRTAKTLAEGAASVISVPADELDSTNEGKLIHITGTAQTDARLEDPVFSISVNAIALERTVEMYQWSESRSTSSEKKLGGGQTTTTTYTYERSWSETLRDSSRFEKPRGHENPTSKTFADVTLESERRQAELVQIGEFQLSTVQIARIGGSEPVPLTEELATALGESLHGRVTVSDQMLFLGGDARKPEIGNLRVRLTSVAPHPVSLIGAQTGNRIGPYRTSTGKTVELQRDGVLSAEQMFAAAETANTLITWGLRIAGYVIMLIGLSMVLRPLSVVADVVPFIGNVVGGGTGIVASLFAATLSLATIGVGWIVYRPLLGIGVLAAAALGIFAMRTLARRSNDEAPAPNRT